MKDKALIIFIWFGCCYSPTVERLQIVDVEMTRSKTDFCKENGDLVLKENVLAVSYGLHLVKLPPINELCKKPLFELLDPALDLISHCLEKYKRIHEEFGMTVYIEIPESFRLIAQACEHKKGLYDLYNKIIKEYAKNPAKDIIVLSKGTKTEAPKTDIYAGPYSALFSAFPQSSRGTEPVLLRDFLSNLPEFYAHAISPFQPPNQPKKPMVECDFEIELDDNGEPCSGIIIASLPLVQFRCKGGKIVFYHMHRKHECFL